MLNFTLHRFLDVNYWKRSKIILNRLSTLLSSHIRNIRSTYIVLTASHLHFCFSHTYHPFFIFSSQEPFCCGSWALPLLNFHNGGYLKQKKNGWWVSPTINEHMIVSTLLSGSHLCILWVWVYQKYTLRWWDFQHALVIVFVIQQSLLDNWHIRVWHCVCPAAKAMAQGLLPKLWSVSSVQRAKGFWCKPAWAACEAQPCALAATISLLYTVICFVYHC